MSAAVALQRRSKWSRDMICFVDSIEVDSLRHDAAVHIPSGSATDMSGCIRAVKKIDPLVSRIIVYEGGRPDILYQRDGEGWTAWLLKARA